MIETPEVKAIFDALQAAGPLTPEQQDLAALKRTFRTDAQHGVLPSYEELKNAGLVTDGRGYRAFLKAAQLSPVERAYKTLPKSVKATLAPPN